MSNIEDAVASLGLYVRIDLVAQKAKTLLRPTLRSKLSKDGVLAELDQVVADLKQSLWTETKLCAELDALAAEIKAELTPLPAAAPKPAPAPLPAPNTRGQHPSWLTAQPQLPTAPWECEDSFSLNRKPWERLPRDYHRTITPEPGDRQPRGRFD